MEELIASDTEQDDDKANDQGPNYFEQSHEAMGIKISGLPYINM